MESPKIPTEDRQREHLITEQYSSLGMQSMGWIRTRLARLSYMLTKLRDVVGRTRIT